MRSRGTRAHADADADSDAYADDDADAHADADADVDAHAHADADAEKPKKPNETDRDLKGKTDRNRKKPKKNPENPTEGGSTNRAPDSTAPPRLCQKWSACLVGPRAESQTNHAYSHEERLGRCKLRPTTRLTCRQAPSTEFLVFSDMAGGGYGAPDATACSHTMASAERGLWSEGTLRKTEGKLEKA